MKLSVIVPVYNEEKTVAKLLDQLLAADFGFWQKEILLINDHSTDKSSEILKKYVRKAGVRLINHDVNQGKTGSIKTGQKEATGNYIIIQDADLEYNPADIKGLLDLATRNKDKVIYGSRFRGRHKDTVFGHKWGNLALTLFTNLLFGCHLTDMETCYKLIPRKLFQKITIETDRFGFEPEITAKLLNRHIPIIEVPISYTKRGFSEGKKLIWWRDGWATIGILIKYRIFKNG